MAATVVTVPSAPFRPVCCGLATLSALALLLVRTLVPQYQDLPAQRVFLVQEGRRGDDSDRGTAPDVFHILARSVTLAYLRVDAGHNRGSASMTWTGRNGSSEMSDTMKLPMDEGLRGHVPPILERPVFARISGLAAPRAGFKNLRRTGKSPGLALLTFADSVQYVFLWWPFFISQVAYAAKQHLSMFLWTGPMPTALSQPSSFCLEDVNMSNLVGGSSSTSSHYIKIVAALLALSEPDVTHVVMLDMDTGISDASSTISLRAFIPPRGPNEASVYFGKSQGKDGFWKPCSCIIIVANTAFARRFLLRWLGSRCGYKDQVPLWDVVLRTYSSEGCLTQPYPRNFTVFDVPYMQLRRHATVKNTVFRDTFVRDGCVWGSTSVVLRSSLGHIDKNFDGTITFFGNLRDCRDPPCFITHLDRFAKNHLSRAGEAGTEGWYRAQEHLAQV
eukprot:CAMPEP_0117462344 /NCGR_PEP_ID=MMETSP0784-20121206/3002_1 /TAXON_ID=39447 /ORGANISM="" /LENGTH=445 /DNA_ID=CAMNT_0005256099 /DNA_START=53 /DNA_END=1387 /DNA_ORIENTATION=-